MSSEQSKDWFEKIGLITIIVSLAFVAYELRQNTNATKSAVVHSVSQQSFDSIALVLENENVLKAQLSVLGGGKPTPEQRHIVDLLYGAVLRIQLNRYLQTEIGVVDPEMILAVGGRKGGSVYAQPDFRAFWARNKNQYTDGFQAYMSEYVLN